MLDYLFTGSLCTQVVSPVTGRVLGTREVRVVNEKVSLLAMKVQVISGVQLSLFPDTDSDNEFVAETAITSKLSAKYQVSCTFIHMYISSRKEKCFRLRKLTSGNSHHVLCSR